MAVIDNYEKLSGKYELHKLLDEGIESGKTEKWRLAAEGFSDIEKEIGFGKV